MNTDEHRSKAVDGSDLRVEPIGVHQRFSAARLSVALFVGWAFFALMFSHGLASDNVGAPQPQKLTEKLKDPSFIADGAKLFAPNCGSAYCHGTGGVGGGAPRLRDKELDPQYVFKTISTGISGTAMLSFRSDFSEEQIWKLVAFIVSDGKVTATSESAPTPAQPATIRESAHSPTAAAGTVVGNAQAGKVLFFDSAQPKSCQACHAINGGGGSVGPDLSNTGARSARDLFSAILVARRARDSRYVVLELALKNGDRVIGVRKEEDAESIRLFDIGELPAVLRTVQKSDISKTETADWAVHKDNASLYTITQLLDLVTFLKSSQSKSSVTLRDMLQ